MFPLCDLNEDDLIQNPLFCKLLATLAQHVDRTGLTLPLRKELEKVVMIWFGIDVCKYCCFVCVCFWQEFIWMKIFAC